MESNTVNSCASGGQSDVFGVVEGHHLILQSLGRFSLFLASFLYTHSLSPKGLGSEIMLPGFQCWNGGKPV